MMKTLIIFAVLSTGCVSVSRTNTKANNDALFDVCVDQCLEDNLAAESANVENGTTTCVCRPFRSRYFEAELEASLGFAK
jgi:hypothetical protein